MPDGRFTVVKYPVGGADWWSGQGYWWDVEFWNESAVETMADMSAAARRRGRSCSTRARARRTRRAETRYALFYGNDVRFRLAGIQHTYDRGAYIVEPERPWRADWVARGIWPDGWTRPHVPMTITVFAKPGQKTAVRRFVTLAASSPDPVDRPPGHDRVEPRALERGDRAAGTLDRQVQVCVPPGGSATVTIEHARRLRRLPRSDEGAAERALQPPGRDPVQDGGVRGRGTADEALSGVRYAPALSSVGRAPARQLGATIRPGATDTSRTRVEWPRAGRT